MTWGGNRENIKVRHQVSPTKLGDSAKLNYAQPNLTQLNRSLMSLLPTPNWLLIDAESLELQT